MSVAWLSDGKLNSLDVDYLASRSASPEDASFTVIIRSFYNETDYTPRNYSENERGYFDHDRIEDHARDILVVVKSYPSTSRREFRFYSPEELP